MNLFELNKKLTTARENGFIIIQINKLTKKIYSNHNVSNKNIQYHLKLGPPPIHRQFFIKISKNKEYIQT